MNTWYYVSILILSLGLSQLIFDKMSKEDIFPLATWNLFSHLPIKREIPTLYFENIEDGSLCYFYLCPGIVQREITTFHPYHIVRWRRKSSDVADYFKGKVDLEKLNYKIHIKVENTTMVEKWKEISQEIRNKK